MDSPRIIFSRRARAELVGIESYIAEQDGEARASLVVDRILDVIRALAAMPGMGRTRPYLKAGARAFPVRPWIVVYIILPSLDGIEVIRIVDGRRDLPGIF